MVITLTAALWLITAAGPATAEPAGTVRVGVYENAPKIYWNDNGEPAGLFVELIREIARNEHWSLEFVPCEWHACLDSLEAGDIDLMPDVAFTERRNRRFEFHQVPVAQSWSVILKRADTPASSLSRLDNRRIAILAGGVQSEGLERMMSGLELSYSPVQYPSYEAAFSAVRDGEADAVAANNFFAAYFARRYGLRETPFVFNPATLYYATPSDDPAGLLPAIDKHLEAWRYDENSIYYDSLKQAMIPAQEPVVPPGLRYTLYTVAALLVLFLAVSALLRWQVRRKTSELRRTSRRLDHMLRSSPVVLYQLVSSDGEYKLRWVSDNIERLLGFAPQAFVAEDRWMRHLHPDDRDAALAKLALLPEEGHLIQEYRVVDARGVTRTVRDEMQYLPGPPGQPDEVVGSWNDLTESRAQAERLSFLAHYDSLTRLPNASLLRERLTQAVYHAAREKRQVAVILVDLDRFKTVNDSLGRSTGDSVLRTVAARLRRIAGAGENLARSGGDGFAIIVEDDAGRRRAESVAERIMEAFAEPIPVGRENVSLTVSAGISLYPDDGSDADTLLQHAEAAMYEAKRAGRNSHCVYSSALSIGAAERLSIESALRSAVAKGELML
ncbi:MAG TPA: diguanylate cyclase, partial [Arenicellales bacterium]|nr:diguanylate cyclase [Arenicellales bacterium]